MKWLKISAFAMFTLIVFGMFGEDKFDPKIKFDLKVDTTRADLQGAILTLQNELQKSKEHLAKENFEKTMKAIRKWNDKNLEKDKKYILANYPFYDDIRAYATAIFCRYYIISSINDAKSQENIDANIKYIDNSKMYDNLIVSAHLALENYMISKFGNDIGLVLNEYLFCKYDNYDTARNIAAGVADGISQDGNFGKTSGLLSALSSVDRETIDCKFRGNVEKYSANYFYTSNLTGKKFFNREVLTNITDKEKINGLEFSSHTIKSNLDFLAIRLIISEGQESIQKLYIFEADRSTKQIVPVDETVFLESIVTSYEFEK